MWYLLPAFSYNWTILNWHGNFSWCKRPTEILRNRFLVEMTSGEFPVRHGPMFLSNWGLHRQIVDISMDHRRVTVCARVEAAFNGTLSMGTRYAKGRCRVDPFTCFAALPKLVGSLLVLPFPPPCSCFRCVTPPLHACSFRFYFFFINFLFFIWHPIVFHLLGWMRPQNGGGGNKRQSLQPVRRIDFGRSFTLLLGVNRRWSSSRFRSPDEERKSVSSCNRHVIIGLLTHIDTDRLGPITRVGNDQETDRAVEQRRRF